MTDGPVQHVVSLPAPALRPFISHYAGGLRRRSASAAHTRDCPSRHAHLIISFAEPIELLRAPGRQQAGRFTALVAGSARHVRPSSGRATAYIWCTSSSLPSACARFSACRTPRSSHASSNSRTSGVHEAHSWSSASETAAAGTRASRTWTRRSHARCGRSECRHRPCGPGNSSPDIRGAFRLPRCARHIGWSRAHFTGRFQAEFGLSPKTAARIFRFEHACRALKAHPRRLADVAQSCGYYDQAHMTREWHALAGSSPRQWIAQELPFVQDSELPPGER